MQNMNAFSEQQILPIEGQRQTAVLERVLSIAKPPMTHEVLA
jgi:hypothetical protein